MKKLLPALAAVATMAFGSGAAADPIETDAGTVTVAEDGYVLLADGNEGNPHPLRGFVAIRATGACANDEGNPGDTDGDGIPNDEDEVDDNSAVCTP